METLPQQPAFVDVLYRVAIATLRFVFSVDFLGTLRVVASLLFIVLVAWFFYSVVRLHEIKREDEEQKRAADASSAAPATGPRAIDLSPAPDRNDLWETIRAKLLSDGPSDWRLGIIEADIYLDRILDSRGFHGDTIGDKLKQVDSLALPSVQLAWEAHKVRNRIAHEGPDFTLTQPEARRTLSRYEIVFRDLGVIA